MIDLFGEVPTKHIPMMPEEYKGKTGKGCGYTKSQPRQWTADELVWIENLRDEGYSNEEIGISTGRTTWFLERPRVRSCKGRPSVPALQREVKRSCSECPPS